jgi:hypothetical protein
LAITSKRSVKGKGRLRTPTPDSRPDGGTASTNRRREEWDRQDAKVIERTQRGGGEMTKLDSLALSLRDLSLILATWRFNSSLPIDTHHPF